MSKGWRCIGWFVGGPIASMFAGYIAFIMLLLACGGAMNIDTSGTPAQEFLAKLVLPIVGAIVVIGSGYSFFRAISCWREKQDEEKA
jgi:hypothetical protein